MQRSVNKGAVAVITDYAQSNLPDATAWIKFGWGSIPRAEGPARLPGFVLSENRGKMLRAPVEQHDTVKLYDTLRGRGLERCGQVGHAPCSLVRALDVWRVRREHLKDVCPACAIRPNIRKRLTGA